MTIIELRPLDSESVTSDGRAAACTVTLCRGCCCGTDKHPDADHEGQLRQLLDGLGTRARVRTTGCLDSCDYSNVFIVQPSVRGRAMGGRPSWLRQVLTPELTEAVISWVKAGGPGVAEPPTVLRNHQLAPARKRRTAAGG